MGQFWYFGGNGDANKRQVNKWIYIQSSNNLFNFRSARLLDVKWCVKVIWLSILLKDLASRSLNRNLEYYCVLTFIILLNAICMLKVDNIIKSRTRFLRFDGEYFQTAGSSKFGHRRTVGMGNYKNKALTTGCENNSSCFVKTELMNMETLQWSNGPDFPFAS